MLIRKKPPPKWLSGWFEPSGGIHAGYAVINCHGGCSSDSFSSLNVGLRVGDERERVVENRQRVQQGLRLNSLLFACQVHGNEVMNIETTERRGICRDLTGRGKGCDGMITSLPDVGLAVQHADCQPVLFCDVEQGVVAAAHCGWRGSVAGILPAIVKQLQEDYQVRPGALQVLIGPSLGSCCAEFLHYESELPKSFHAFRRDENHFDFHGISRMQLVQAGVHPKKIRVLGICTCCSQDYFSYRRAKRESGGATGRNCTVIYLKREQER